MGMPFGLKSDDLRNIVLMLGGIPAVGSGVAYLAS